MYQKHQFPESLRSNTTLSTTYASIVNSPSSPTYTSVLMEGNPATNTRSRTVSIKGGDMCNPKLLSLRTKPSAVKKTSHHCKSTSKGSTLKPANKNMRQQTG